MLTNTWRKSSLSGNGGCVEARYTAEQVEVRDTKDRTLPAHRYTRAEWTAFLAGVRNAEFDLPEEG